MYKWTICEWEDIEHLRKIAKKEKHNVNPSVNTVWYGLTNGKEYVIYLSFRSSVIFFIILYFPLYTCQSTL